MREYQVMGRPSVKDEFTQEHCRRLARWFDGRGRFVHHGSAPNSRERLWNCMSLLVHGAPRYRDLAQQIICRTPIDHNHFEPFAAVEILLRFPDRLQPKTARYLTRIVREHFLNTFEFRFGSADSHNFTCMGSWFLLAAGQVMDGYEWKHPLGSIPEVYTRSRIKDIGMNALYALAHLSDTRPVFSEWNSPTYSPISLHCLAKIVELIDDPEAKGLALRIEQKLWHEILGLYHPNLSLSCGPWSRAYRCDMLGQISQMRILLAYLGISKDRSVVELFDERQKDVVFHHDGDIPFMWSGPAWQMAGRFHVPCDALRELEHRRFPHRFEAAIRWKSTGHIDPKTRKFVPVQGDALPGGEGAIVQVQRKSWSLGWRTRTGIGQSFPINLHYALRPAVRTMRDVRSVTAGVLFHKAPEEWVQDQKGRPMEASNFNNEGWVEVKESPCGRLALSAHPFGQMASMPSDELSFNTFVPMHFVPVGRVELDGVPFSGSPLQCRGRRACCVVRDAGFRYEVEYEFSEPVDIVLYRWANFIRFAGFWYRGPSRLFTPQALERLGVRADFAVAGTPRGA